MIQLLVFLILRTCQLAILLKVEHRTKDVNIPPIRFPTDWIFDSKPHYSYVKEAAVHNTIPRVMFLSAFLHCFFRFTFVFEVLVE